MDDLERRQTEMIWRVGNFGTENADAVHHNTRAVAAFAAIQTVIAALEAKGITRSSTGDAALSNSAQRRFRRSELYDDLLAIAKTARQIALENPDFVNKFIISQTNKSDLDKIETARAFAADLVAVKQLFLDLATDEDFIEDLIADADALEATINAQDTSSRGRVGANADIDDLLKDALKAVSVLKIIIPNIYKGNPGKSAEWISASHVEKMPKRAKE